MSTIRSQQDLIHAARLLFPKTQISVNSRKDSHVKLTEDKYLEIDVWLPQLNLCFEFQDAYHYVSTWYSNVPIKKIQKTDRHKQEMIMKKGDTLIVIPCWWDGSVESLSATVSFYRPDLIDFFYNDIHCKDIANLNPPLNFFKYGTIPQVGELMLASFAMDPSFLSSVSSKNSWWVGEKYDGIRCCWNALQEELYTRAAVSISLPPAMISKLPQSLFVDGEIWFGRGSFIHSVKLADSDIDSLIDWQYLRLMCFDVPSQVGTPSVPFENRYSLLNTEIETDHPFSLLAPRIECSNQSNLSFLLHNILDNSGEGLIMRKPGSKYIHGRSPFLIKLKITRSDLEAVVTEVGTDTIRLALPDGTTFEVPHPLLTHSYDQENLEYASLKKGDIVTVACEQFSRRGTPMNATITRKRDDLTWQQVVENYGHGSSSAKIHGSREAKSRKEIPQLNIKDSQLRANLIEFAQSRNTDPFLPDTWYSFQKKDINLKIEGYVDTLMRVFPDIGIDPTKFHSLHILHKRTIVANRRILFDKLAREAFTKDPLLAENWYNIVKLPISDKEVKAIVHFHYDDDFAKAIFHLYPEIGLDHKYLFSGSEERKSFFLDFASSQGFDPYVPENWYGIHMNAFLSREGCNQALSPYKMNVLHALQDLFPSLKFDEYQFFLKPRNYWLNEDNKRNFFIKFAESRGFDPLVAENWYQIPISDIISYKGATIITRDKGITSTLIKLFPNIGLDVTRFRQVPPNYWHDNNNRREFFEGFAAKNRFDPLVVSNWYGVTKSQVIAYKGYSGVLEYYANLPLAIADIFPEIGLDLSRFVFYTRNKGKRH